MNFEVLWCLLVDVVLMQTQKFFCRYSHGDLTTKVLSIESFVLYGIWQLSHRGGKCKLLAICTDLITVSFMHAYTHMHAHLHIRTCMLTCMYTHVQTCTDTYTHAHTCTTLTHLEVRLKL